MKKTLVTLTAAAALGLGACGTEEPKKQEQVPVQESIAPQCNIAISLNKTGKAARVTYATYPQGFKQHDQIDSSEIFVNGNPWYMTDGITHVQGTNDGRLEIKPRTTQFGFATLNLTLKATTNAGKECRTDKTMRFEIKEHIPDVPLNVKHTKSESVFTQRDSQTYTLTREGDKYVVLRSTADVPVHCSLKLDYSGLTMSAQDRGYNAALGGIQINEAKQGMLLAKWFHEGEKSYSRHVSFDKLEKLLKGKAGTIHVRAYDLGKNVCTTQPITVEFK